MKRSPGLYRRRDLASEGAEVVERIARSIAGRRGSAWPFAVFRVA